MKRLHILLVEDDEMIREITSHYLEKIGHEVDIAINGNVAIQKFKSGTYDIILMDVQMPEMNGLEAVKIIRKMESERGLPGKHIPIIAITANSNENECRDAGIDDYARKPFNLEQFEELFCSYNLS